MVFLESGFEVAPILPWGWHWCIALATGAGTWTCQFVFEHALWWSTLVPHGSGLGVAFVMGIGIVWRLLLFAWSMPLVAHGVPPWG